MNIYESVGTAASRSLATYFGSGVFVPPVRACTFFLDSPPWNWQVPGLFPASLAALQVL